MSGPTPTDDDRFDPVYCRGCHQQCARTALNAAGYCGACQVQIGAKRPTIRMHIAAQGSETVAKVVKVLLVTVAALFHGVILLGVSVLLLIGLYQRLTQPMPTAPAYSDPSVAIAHGVLWLLFVCAGPFCLGCVVGAAVVYRRLLEGTHDRLTAAAWGAGSSLAPPCFVAVFWVALFVLLLLGGPGFVTALLIVFATVIAAPRYALRLARLATDSEN